MTNRNDLQPLKKTIANDDEYVDDDDDDGDDPNDETAGCGGRGSTHCQPSNVTRLQKRGKLKQSSSSSSQFLSSIIIIICDKVTTNKSIRIIKFINLFFKNRLA